MSELIARYRGHNAGVDRANGFHSHSLIYGHSKMSNGDPAGGRYWNHHHSLSVSEYHGGTGAARERVMVIHSSSEGVDAGCCNM